MMPARDYELPISYTIPACQNLISTSTLPRKAWKTPLQKADATNRTTLRVCDGNTPYHRPSTTQDVADRPDRERQRGLPVPLYPLRRSPSPIKTTNQSQKNQTSLRRNLSQLRIRTGQGLRLPSLPSSCGTTPPHQPKM